MCVNTQSMYGIAIDKSMRSVECNHVWVKGCCVCSVAGRMRVWLTGCRVHRTGRAWCLDRFNKVEENFISKIKNYKLLMCKITVY